MTRLHPVSLPQPIDDSTAFFARNNRIMKNPIRVTILFVFALAHAWVLAQTTTTLPPEFEAALARAKVPREAVTVLVVDADGANAPRIAHRAQVPVNPASVMKLVTTYAALDQLGPAFTWRTPVFADGIIKDGVLNGNLYIKGQGDPKLVVERLWLLLRRVQGLGIGQVKGDIVLDRSAFADALNDPADFDGEPLRPYNASPDALLLNFKALVVNFVPDRPAGVAYVQIEPPLSGVQVPASVGLSSAECGDWRTALKADFSDPNRLRFAGSYPANCGERTWPVAYAEPRSHAVRAVAGLWSEMGGKLTGVVREGTVPLSLKPVLEISSSPLLDAVRDINKYSNNVMAQQLFLTLGLLGNSQASLDTSRVWMRQWWQGRFGDADTPVFDNGSGLSRKERISAQALGRMLQTVWGSSVMPELMSSLPVTGVDGTMKRSKAKTSAHLKTGTLRDVAAIAGYVHAASGKRYVLVAIANHPNAGAARPAFDALIDWVARD